MPDAQYEPFADAFTRHAETGAYNALYDRPTMLALLGDVAGRRVLDLGCGPGLYAEELVRRGAEVHGLDASPTLVARARARVPSARFDVADLEAPLGGVPEAWADVVLAALVIHHVERRAALLQEVRRALRPGGALVVSTTHPTWDWQHVGGGYFDRGWVEETWQQDWRVRYWRQPLSDWCGELTDAGFLIERLVEHRASPELGERDPGAHARLSSQPGFVGLRLLRP